MKSSARSLIVFSAAVLLGALPLVAQMPPAPAMPASGIPAPRVRTSPHEIISNVFEGNRVTIIYGRPYSKDPKSGAIRKIWGDLVPFDKVWRTGSDEATTLITQQPIELGGALIPAGAYTLYTLPAADGSAKLIVNKQLGQWGIERDGSTTRNEKFDVAQVALTKEALDPQVDEFTMAVAKGPSGGGLLILGWEKTKYSVAFTVKK